MVTGGDKSDSVPSKSNRHPIAIASILMLATTFFWASNIVAGKVALTGFKPLALAQLRMAGAAILYFISYVAWRGLPTLRLTRNQWLILTVMALTGITLNQICYIGGLSLTSVTHTGLIQAIGPIFVLLLAASMRMETLSRGKIVGMSVSFAGVALLLIEKPPRGSGANWLGDVIVIAAGGLFAYYTILMKQVTARYDPLTLNVVIFGLGAILLTPFCAVSLAGTHWNQIPPHAWWGLAYMVIFGSFIAYLIYAFALETLSASRVAAFAYLQPLMAAVMGVWLLGEKISLAAVIGGSLILAGVYLTENARGERKHIQQLARGRI